ncbi:hypothetical protein RRG08_031522, partial [Elysia crispata]
HVKKKNIEEFQVYAGSGRVELFQNPNGCNVNSEPTKKTKE